MSFVHEAAAQQNANYDGRDLKVLYIGDFDAAGVLIDVALEREMRQHLDAHIGLDFERVGINLDQVREFGLPMNPRKTSDKRSQQVAFAVEAEAMPAKTLRGILRAKIEALLPVDALRVAKAAELSERAHLVSIAKMLQGAP